MPISRRQWLAATAAALAAARLGHGQPAVATGPGGAMGPVRINPLAEGIRWEGWGCSLAWWAKVFGQRDDLADVFFTRGRVTVEGQTVPGLGFNYARYNAGACSAEEVDGQRMAVSPRMIPSRQIDGFWVAPGRWDWTVDRNQRAMLLKARDRGVDKIELFSNSPMWWMCGNRNPSGAEEGGENLAREHFGNFAAYLATVAKEFRDRFGIAFDLVEPFNEPASNWWKANNNQEGCSFSIAAQAEILRQTRAELDARGLQGVKLAASDANTYDEAVRIWEGFDDATRALVPHVNVHGYQRERGQRTRLSEITRGKTLWNSEYGENDFTGLTMAHNIHLDLHHLKPSLWAYWQPLDGSNWGLINADMDKAELGTVNPKHFVLVHYTRHIRPGMKILPTGDIASVAAWDEKSNTLALVALNRGDTEVSVDFDLSKFERAAESSVQQWLTAAPPGAITRGG